MRRWMGLLNLPYFEIKACVSFLPENRGSAAPHFANSQNATFALAKFFGKMASVKLIATSSLRLKDAV